MFESQYFLDEINTCLYKTGISNYTKMQVLLRLVEQSWKQKSILHNGLIIQSFTRVGLIASVLLNF